jgi:Phosphotransferase enzyme family
VRFPTDPGLVKVLAAFDVQPGALLGHGGEAWVYALDEERVIRVLHEGGALEMVLASAELATKLSQSRPPFSLPELIDVGEVQGRCYAIERRLSGRPVAEELARVDDRAALIEAYLECSSQLGALALDHQDWWGDLLRVPPVRSETWRDYLRRKAEASLTTAGTEFARINAGVLAEEMPTETMRSFVHLDAFPGNMLAVGTTITAVIDLGTTALAGDRRLDPLASVVYLTPAITPTAEDRDRDVAQAWLRNAGLEEFFRAAQRWLAAYWSFAIDDRRLHAWCRSVLLTR